MRVFKWSGHCQKSISADNRGHVSGCLMFDVCMLLLLLLLLPPEHNAKLAEI